MASRETKLRRLNEFRRSKAHCSASAMSQILSDIRLNGLPELTDRNSVREARNLITSTPGAYGSVLQSIECVDKDGAAHHLPIACPFASLSAAVERNDGFSAFMQRQLRLHPPSPNKPWNIILYSDEVTPGNPLSVMNIRKFNSVYWSFAEFDTIALSHEESWFVLMAEFSTRVNAQSGGLSQVFGNLIKSFFQPGGFHMMDGGMNLHLGGEDYRLFAKIGVVLQDGGAHKATWQARGDGASKFCLLCKNLFTHDSNVHAADGTHLLRCNLIKLHELVASTDNELRTNARFLESMSRTMGAEQFIRLQQAVGLTYAPHGILIDRSLNLLIQPTDVFMHDYMHALFVDGVLNFVIFLCFEAFIKSGKTGIYESFSEFVSNWKFPGKFHANHLSDIFTSDRRDRHRAAKHIKCQASDLLALLGVLVLYVRTVLLVLEQNPDACRALLSLVELSQHVVATGRIPITPEKLLGIVHRFLEEFTNAFGFEWLTPKCHWLLHLPEALGRHGRLFNCFVLERKHRVPKRYATDMQNVFAGTSKALLTEVVCHHLSSLKAADFDYVVGLIRGRPARSKSRRLILAALGLDDDGTAVLTASEARFSPLATCRRDDIVLLRDGTGMRAARIQLHCMVANECVSLVQPFTLHRRMPGTALAVWQVNDGPHECWELKAILAAVEFCVYPDGRVGTLLPIEFM